MLLTIFTCDLLGFEHCSWLSGYGSKEDRHTRTQASQLFLDLKEKLKGVILTASKRNWRTAVIYYQDVFLMLILLMMLNE